jgi:sec-independent protein translocase protein TatA
MIGNVSITNLLIILAILLLLFGAKKIPELAKGLGSGMREFKKAAKELDTDDAKATSANDAESPQTGDKHSS